MTLSSVFHIFDVWTKLFVDEYMAYMALCIEENRSDTEKNQHVQYVAHGLPRVENSSTVSAKEKKHVSLYL